MQVVLESWRTVRQWDLAYTRVH